MIEQPEFIEGGDYTDFRGRISFVNDFQLNNVQRFYVIEQKDVDVVRAWQAHRHENKWFHVIEGSFKIVIVRLDDWENPSQDLKTMEFDLSSANIGVLHVPGGYANGFKALEPNSKIMVFSDSTLEQSANDNYRFDQGFWYKWNKK